jgi:hypothetical protein
MKHLKVIIGRDATDSNVTKINHLKKACQRCESSRSSNRKGRCKQIKLACFTASSVDGRLEKPFSPYCFIEYQF